MKLFENFMTNLTVNFIYVPGMMICAILIFLLIMIAVCTKMKKEVVKNDEGIKNIIAYSTIDRIEKISIEISLLIIIFLSILVVVLLV